MRTMSEALEVEVAWALPGRALLKSCRLPPGATAADALRAAAADAEFAAAGVTAAGVPAGCAIGIFGQVVGLARVLEPGDRVEIYRPLAADPKSARRARVRAARR